MVELIFLIKGVVIGFAIAAPVGPIGVLCIQRTLMFGNIAGLVSGLGAATADAFYGAIAGYGLTFISVFLIKQRFWLQLVGGLFLLYLGIKTFSSKTYSINEIQTQRKNLYEDYFSTLFLTITNPMTIMSFVAVFAGLGLGNTNGNFLFATILVIGVFLGSAIWWLILSSSVNLIKHKINEQYLKRVNYIAALLILTFGLIALFSLFSGF